MQKTEGIIHDPHINFQKSLEWTQWSQRTSKWKLIEEDLTLKCQQQQHKFSYFHYYYFSEKIRLNISWIYWKTVWIIKAYFL